MTDKNKDAQLKDAEAKQVSGGQWSDQWRPNQAKTGDGTSVTPPPPTKNTVQLWETIGTPGVDEIYIPSDPMDGGTPGVPSGFDKIPRG